MTASFSAGQILGPVFAGYVYDATGSLAMPSLVAVAALVLAALLSLVADAAAPRAQPFHVKGKSCWRTKPFGM